MEQGSGSEEQIERAGEITMHASAAHGVEGARDAHDRKPHCPDDGPDGVPHSRIVRRGDRDGGHCVDENRGAAAGEQISGRRRHAAQHESLERSVSNAWAASLIPSDNVRYGWNSEVRSSIVRPSLIASAGSVIISLASPARICAPTIFRVAA